MEFLMYLGYILAPLGSILTWYFSRAQSRKELERLQAEVEGLKKTNTGVDISNIKAAAEILTDNVVKPLEKELQRVSREVSKFRKAVEKIKSCKYEDECPVKDQLYKLEDHDDKTVD